MLSQLLKTKRNKLRKQTGEEYKTDKIKERRKEEGSPVVYPRSASKEKGLISTQVRHLPADLGDTLEGKKRKTKKKYYHFFFIR